MGVHRLQLEYQSSVMTICDVS